MEEKALHSTVAMLLGCLSVLAMFTDTFGKSPVQALETARAGGRVITLAEDIIVPAGSSVELDPVDVSAFNEVFLHASSSDYALIQAAFTIEPGKYSEPVPKFFAVYCQVGSPGSYCATPSAAGGSLSRVAGPFLAVSISAGNAPVTITLKAYLRR